MLLLEDCPDRTPELVHPELVGAPDVVRPLPPPPPDGGLVSLLDVVPLSPPELAPPLLAPPLPSVVVTLPDPPPLVGPPSDDVSPPLDPPPELGSADDPADVAELPDSTLDRLMRLPLPPDDVPPVSGTSPPAR